MSAFLQEIFRGAELDVPEVRRGQLAWDAIVAIVNINNPLINVTAEDLKKIYNGTYKTWADVLNK